jgi:hypothetical protein
MSMLCLCFIGGIKQVSSELNIWQHSSLNQKEKQKVLTTKYSQVHNHNYNTSQPNTSDVKPATQKLHKYNPCLSTHHLTKTKRGKEKNLNLTQQNFINSKKNLNFNTTKLHQK